MYAAEHWVGHARSENVSANVEDGMKRLFDPRKNHLLFWTFVRDPESPSAWHRYNVLRPPKMARATPLHYAAFCGLHDIAAFLIVEHSQDVNARGFDKGEAPLHVALRCSHADIAQLLLEHGADAKAQNNRGRTPLFLASEGGHLEVVRVLLERGADVEASGMDGSPLEQASDWGHVEVVRVLLEHGADAKALNKRNNRTPLHFAQGEMIARLLIEHGADVRALDSISLNPLHLASGYGHVGVARVLLEHGADVNSRDYYKETALHRASDHRASIHGEFPELVRLLLQYDSDVNARDTNGSTPFRRAKARGYHDIMQVLLEYGAEDNDLDSDD
jgi:cytohesin